MKALMLLMLLGISLRMHASENTLYEEVTYNKPEVGEVNEVYLGDRMLAQQVGEWRECITPRKNYSKSSWGWTAIYKAGEPICKKELAAKYYWPTYVNSTGHGNEMTELVSWRGKKGKSKLCQTSGAMRGQCVKNLSEDDVEHGETFIYRANSFQQTIEYAGKSDDILKFNYSEFTNGFARQAFTREFQVDLKEGNVAAYKGAIIEIVEATNVQIKYKVMRNFASDR